MWNSIDRGGDGNEGGRSGSSSVACSIRALINNIKGKSWQTVDEMKSLSNVKAGGGGGGRKMFLSAGYCRARAAEETNNLSFINSRLKQKHGEGLKKAS